MNALSSHSTHALSSHTFGLSGLTLAEDCILSVSITQTIQSFSPRDREVLFAIYWEGKTVYEIADDIGTHYSRVSQLHQRMLKKIREAIQ